MSIASPLSNWIISPGVLRFGFGMLRRVMPVLRIGRNVIVTRHDDVMEVLTRDRDFTIRQINDRCAHGSIDYRTSGRFDSDNCMWELYRSILLKRPRRLALAELA
jgi:hypothetical protein